MKKTDELLKSLKESKSIDEYINTNKDSIISENLSQLFTDYIDSKGLKRSEIGKKSELSDSYCYQILSGIKKNPDRDKVLAILIAMSLTIDETQQFLKAAGYPFLYAKNKRDSILIYCISKGMSVMEINNELYKAGEKTL